MEPQVECLLAGQQCCYLKLKPNYWIKSFRMEASSRQYLQGQIKYVLVCGACLLGRLLQFNRRFQICRIPQLAFSNLDSAIVAPPTHTSRLQDKQSLKDACEELAAARSTHKDACELLACSVCVKIRKESNAVARHHVTSSSKNTHRHDIQKCRIQLLLKAD